jgi:hypothetical protein
MHVRPLSGVELAYMTPQPFLSASDATKALFEVESGRTAQEQLTHRMVQEATGVDFVPSVVADAIGLSNASTGQLLSELDRSVRSCWTLTL